MGKMKNMLSILLEWSCTPPMGVMKKRIVVPVEDQKKIRVWAETLPLLREVAREHGVSQPQIVHIAIAALKESA